MPQLAVAAEDATAINLLDDLQSTTSRLRQVEMQGQNIKDTRASNRREMNRMESQASALTGDRSKIDNRVADYTAESQVFNSECSGVTVTQAQSRNCDSRQRELATLAASIDRDAARLGSKVDDYNAEVEEYNARDAELATQEESLQEQSRILVQQIEDIKSQFESLAVSYSDDNFVTDVRRCNILPGFEDTHFCLSAVWRIVSHE